MKLYRRVERQGQTRNCRALYATIGVGLGLLLLLLLAGCSPPKAESQGMRIPPVPVTIASVTLKTVPVELHAIGNVEAYSTINVKSQVEGRLERVYFKEGQDVKKGDLIFTIDPRPFDAALQQAEANLARDKALEANAQAQADRNAKLFESGIVSKDQYEQFRTSADSYAAEVRADQAAVEKAKVDLDYCTIHSPIDGRTGSLLVHEGNLVKANGDTPLVVINQVTPIYVDFSVPEQYLAEIKKRKAAGSLRVEAVLPNEEQHPAQGLLTFVDNAVDQTTGTIRLKGLFPNQERRLWPGQFVNTVLRLTAQPNAVVVPSQAVQTGQSGQYVFVVNPDLAVESRPVVVGQTVQGETVIQKGLQPGEKVVTDGQLRLIPGSRVEIRNPA
jgi:membrane fusion protein, multidrug efflux system